MKTVAHLLPNYNPFPPTYPAGTELRVAQVARQQSRYRPIVICGGFPGQPALEQLEAMTIRRIHFSRIYRRIFQKITRLDPVPYSLRMWRIIREENASLLHIHNEPKLLAMLEPFLESCKLPVVVHIANDKPIQKRLIQFVSHWVACSHYMADWLHTYHGISKDRISVIYTGVDSIRRRPRWEVDDADQIERKARWGVGPEDFVFLFAGRLVKEKGVAEMLDAFERLRIDRPVKLLVAGNVRDSNDPKNEKAVYGRAVATRMSQMQNVRWVGSLHPDAVHDFLLVGDVFLLPSQWHDPFPTVMIEAACAGLPIVAGKRGGITEFLKDAPDVDLLDDPSDVDELAAAMARLASVPGAGQATARWLRQKIVSDFDWSRVTREFEALYDRLLEGLH